MAVGTMEQAPVSGRTRRTAGRGWDRATELPGGEAEYCPTIYGDCEPDGYLDIVLARVDGCIQDTAATEVRERACGLGDEELRSLAAVLGHDMAENTKRNYRAQWLRFAHWAMDKGIRALPADPVRVAAYLAERLETHGHRPATLHIASSAIAFIHRASGHEDPCDAPEVRRTLRSASRMVGAAQRQAEGLTEEALESIRITACLPRRGRGGRMERAETALRRGRADIAIMSLMRDALLRVSEAAAIRWEDIEEEEDGTGRLLIRRSKTDGEGKGAVVFVSAPTMRSLEPIRHGASGEDGVFGLRPRQISMRIKQAARAAGLGEGFSGHSPRVGMARDLARDGAELPRLMTAGRWRSPRMPAHYTRNESVARGAVAEYYGAHRRRAGPNRSEAARNADEASQNERAGEDVLTDATDVFSGRLREGPEHMSACRRVTTYGKLLSAPDPMDGHLGEPSEDKARIKAFIGALTFRAETIAKPLPGSALLAPTALAELHRRVIFLALFLNLPLCYLHPA